MKEERKIEIRTEPLGEFRTPRACAVCLEPATLEVCQLRKDGKPELASLRFACAAHATNQLWPMVKRVALVALPNRLARDIFKGDLTEFYATILRELGGEMPVPALEEPAAPREKVWLPLEPLVQRPVTKGYGVSALRGYTVRLSKPPKGPSGRQWRKRYKAIRLAVKRRMGASPVLAKGVEA